MQFPMHLYKFNAAASDTRVNEKKNEKKTTIHTYTHLHSCQMWVRMIQSLPRMYQDKRTKPTANSMGR